MKTLKNEIVFQNYGLDSHNNDLLSYNDLVSHNYDLTHYFKIVSYNCEILTHYS